MLSYSGDRKLISIMPSHCSGETRQKDGVSLVDCTQNHVAVWHIYKMGDFSYTQYSQHRKWLTEEITIAAYTCNIA